MDQKEISKFYFKDCFILDLLSLLPIFMSVFDETYLYDIFNIAMLINFYSGLKIFNTF